MPLPIENLRKIRLEKLAKIKKLGVNPYPPDCWRQQTVAEAREKEGKKVAVAGRLMAIRKHGGIQFFDLCDESGKIQLVFKEERITTPILRELLCLLDIGDFLDVRGEVFKTQAGEISILVEEFRLLAKSLRPLPSKWYGLKDIEARYRRRYVDLIMNPSLREMFRKKSRFWSAAREYLVKKGFLEVETPVLELVPGGADARPFVTHHWALDTDLYLRISPELHLKRLIVGGFEKIFEIGRIFRNEGMDAEHLQDYTQLEFYWAYADYKKLLDFLEDFYRFLVERTLGKLVSFRKGREIDWGREWQRLDFCQIFRERTGLDPLKASKKELARKAEELGLAVSDLLGRGRLIDLIHKKIIRPSIFQPTFLLHLPVTLSPLAKRDPENPEVTQRVLVLAGGTELGNGFSELNDPLDQKERFKKQQALREAGDEEAQMYDRDFVEALEYGMPPTAGFGLSERFFAFLFDKPLRECVFFPLMRREELI